MSIGPLSLEHREKIIAATLGVPKTPEHRAAIKASWTPERCALQSKRVKATKAARRSRNAASAATTKGA